MVPWQQSCGCAYCRVDGRERSWLLEPCVIRTVSICVQGQARAPAVGTAAVCFAAGMKRFVLNGRDRTDGCLNAAFFRTQPASFSVRWRWRWQCDTTERTCWGGRAAKQPHGHQSSSAVPSKFTNHGSRLQDF